MVNLSELVRDYKIFVDTSSFMYRCSEPFLRKILPIHLSQNNTKIIVPYRVIQELEKHQNSKDNLKSKAAIRGLSIVQQYLKTQIIDIRGEQNDTFPDNLFQTIFTKFRIKYNLCIFTQDKGLAEDICHLKKSKSVSSKKEIKILFINDNGDIEDWENRRHYKKQTEIKTEIIKKFQFYNTPIQLKDEPISVSFLPDIGDTVRSDKYGQIKLIKEIGKGGEGSIYLTDNGMIGKIYLKEKLTLLKLEKLKLMLKNQINFEGICWPKDIIYNSKNEIIGYLMNKAEGKPLQNAFMLGKPVLIKNFPNWTRKNLVELSINILEKINHLHQRNIIIGDLSPLNILIVDNTNEIKTFFVDTDSYQIENYPCPVGTINYTAPEIQGKDYKAFLRTFEHEYFAVATLLFMILLPGKPPYSQQGGSDPAHNIKTMNFSYPLGEKTTKKAPYGPWRFIWSNLPYSIKEAFYGVFINNNRIPTDEWLDLMRSYLYSLNHRYISDEMFPTSLKILDPIEVICSKCNKNFIESKDWIEKLKAKNKDYVCKECLVEVICSVCNQKFRADKIWIEELERQNKDYICRECRNKKLFPIQRPRPPYPIIVKIKPKESLLVKFIRSIFGP